METKEKLSGMIDSVVADLSLELVEFDLFQAGSRIILRIYIDKEGGVTVDDCKSVSRELSLLFDLEDPLEDAYTLEVSSPGVDRPLKTTKDFQRNIGRTLKISLSEALENKKLWIGELLSVDESEIVLKAGEANALRIVRDSILLAKIEIVF